MSVTAPSASTPQGQFFTLADLGLPISQTQFLAQWLSAMQTAFPGYNPAPANLEYVQAQVFASWAAELAQLCSAGSMELFRQFGTQLLGVPYEQGSPASAVMTVNATDAGGYTLPLGTQITLTLAGALVAFQTVSVLVIPAGSTSGTVTIAAVQAGTAANGATTPISLVSQINWVASVSLAAAASGGVDQEDDSAYVLRLAQTLTTLGFATATASALATRALDFIPTPGSGQQQVGRATSIDGYSPAASTFTVTTTSGSASLTVTGSPASGVTAAPGSPVSGTGLPSTTFTATTTSGSATLTAVSSTAGLTVDAFVSGTGIPAGTQILSVGVGQVTLTANATATATGVTVTASTAIVQSSTSSTIVLSAAATASGTGVAATVGGTLGNQRVTTVCVTDPYGNQLNSVTMTAVQAYLQGFRELNFILNAVSPAYSTVYVTVSVSALAGFTTATVQANVQAALLAYLSPQNFGLPQGAIQGWQNTQTVYLSQLTAVIQGALGVAYVHAGTVAVGLTANPTNTTADLVLPGDFPLPTATSTSIPLTAITVS